MTTTTALIVSTIVLVFVLFGSVLAWFDFYSRRERRSHSSASLRPLSQIPPHQIEHRDAA